MTDEIKLYCDRCEDYVLFSGHTKVRENMEDCKIRAICLPNHHIIDEFEDEDAVLDEVEKQYDERVD